MRLGDIMDELTFLTNRKKAVDHLIETYLGTNVQARLALEIYKDSIDQTDPIKLKEIHHIVDAHIGSNFNAREALKYYKESLQLAKQIQSLNNNNQNYQQR